MPASAEPNPLSPQDQRLVEDVVLCYRFAVIKNAVQTCFHAEAVLTEAYTLCGSFEKKLKDEIAATVHDPAFPQHIVDGIRDETRIKLREVFVENRARSNPGCP